MYRKLLERRWLVIVLVFLAAAAGLGAFLPRITVDANTELLLDKRDPDLTYYSRSRRLWPSDDEFAIVCCRRTDWFTPESLGLLHGIADALKNGRSVPHVKNVVSLLDIPLLRNGGSLRPPTIEMTGVDLAKAKDELKNHAVAKGTLISEDCRDAVLLVYLEQPPGYAELDRQRNEALEKGDDATVASMEADYEKARIELRTRRQAFVEGVRAVAREWTPKMDGPIRLSGLPLINLSLIEFVTNDVNVFGVLSFSLFAAAFAAIYRRFRWTFFPILTCLVPVVLILGFMAAVGWKLTVITANLPLLLFVLMLPFTVYFIERYRERRAKAAEEHATTTAGAAGDVWVPCLYSCTTIMAGFASLLTSGVKPVWWFGLMMTVGLAVGLACVFLFLPSTTVKLPALEDPRATGEPRPASFMKMLERSVLRAPALLGAAGLALYVGGAFACTLLTAENKFIDYFWPDGNPLLQPVLKRATAGETYRGLEHIDQHMGGTTPLDIVLTSKQPGFFFRPAGLAAIRAATEFVAKKENASEVGSVSSLATLIDEAHKPDSLLAKHTDQGVVQLGMSDSNLRPLILNVATPNFSTARVLVRFRETSPTLHRKQFLDALRADLAKRPELAELSPRVTGVFLLYSNMLDALLKAHTETFWTVILAISLMLMTLFGFRRPIVQVPVAVGLSVVLFFVPVVVRDVVGIAAAAAAITSLVAALTLRLDERLAARGHHRAAAFVHTLAVSVVVHVPEILPAVVVLGVMGVTGIPLDLITVTIAAISMGVGIDAAIQYTVRYRLELAATGGDRRAAVTRSHATIGRSIWIATSIMVAGFAVMVFSDFVPTYYFGLFNALAMVIGQFAALTVLPSLFLLTGLPRR